MVIAETGEELWICRLAYEHSAYDTSELPMNLIGSSLPVLLDSGELAFFTPTKWTMQHVQRVSEAIRSAKTEGLTHGQTGEMIRAILKS